jgi:hypothetical protein
MAGVCSARSYNEPTPEPKATAEGKAPAEEEKPVKEEAPAAEAPPAAEEEKSGGVFGTLKKMVSGVQVSDANFLCLFILPL